MVTRQPVSCPAQVPSVAGMTYDEVASSLAGLGWIVIRNDVTVEDPAAHHIVIAVSPRPGNWVDLGGSVTLTVGVYEGGGKEEGGEEAGGG